MGNEAWPAHWFKKKNIQRSSVQDCIHELRVSQGSIPRASAQLHYESQEVLTFVRRYLPDYDAFCGSDHTTNHLQEYTDIVLCQKMQMITSLIERLMVVEIEPRRHQQVSYGILHRFFPTRAYHVRLLDLIGNNIVHILRQRTNTPNKQEGS